MQITGMGEASQRREGNATGNKKKGDIDFIYFFSFFLAVRLNHWTAREFPCFISLIKYEIKRKNMNIGVIIVSSLFLYLCTLKIIFDTILPQICR